MPFIRFALLCIALFLSVSGIANAGDCTMPDGNIVPCSDPDSTNPPVITTTVTGNVSGSVQQMIRIVETIENTLKAYADSSPLKGLGVSMLIFLFTIQVIWLIVKGIATGRMLDQFLGDILPLGVASIVALFFMGEEGSTTIGKAIQGLTDQIGSLAAPGFYSGNSVAGLVKKSVESTGYIVLDLFKLPMATSSMGVLNLLTGGAFIVLLSAIFKLITIVIVFCILAVALGTFIATVILTQVSIYIALIFLPVFVPLMIFKPTSSMFDAWVSFLVSSALAKVIGALILQLTDKIFEAMRATAGTLPQMGALEERAMTFNIDIVTYLMLILMAFICLLMVSRIETIARALGGSVVSGFKGFAGESGFKGAMGGVDMKSALGVGGQRMGGLGTATNATSALTAAMPNMLKPISNAIGNSISSSEGKKFASQEAAFQGQKDAFVGPHKQGQEPGKTNQHDASKMSTATAKSYTAALEKINAGRSAGVSQGTQRNLTIQPSHSTTSPKHADNLPRQGSSSPQHSGGGRPSASGGGGSANAGTAGGTASSSAHASRRLGPDRAAAIQSRTTPNRN